MKKVNRINEYTNGQGIIDEVEIEFADNTKATFYGIESRKGSLGKEVIDLIEYKKAHGELAEIEIMFANGAKVTYKGNMTRKGNL